MIDLKTIRTDVVGSLLRPQNLKEARVDFDEGVSTRPAFGPSKMAQCKPRCGCRKVPAST
jgi:hypothetical protein